MTLHAPSTLRGAVARAIDQGGPVLSILGFAAFLVATCRSAGCVEHLADDRFLTACVEMKHEPHDCRIALRDDLEVSTRVTPLEVAP